MQLPNWILQLSTDQQIALLQTIVGAAGLFGLYWQLRKANQVSKAESYVNIRATLASLNQTIIDNKELGTEIGEDKLKTFFDMILAYFEMPFILRRLRVIDQEVFDAERRSLRKLLNCNKFRSHCESRLEENLYDREFLRFLRNLLNETKPASL